MILPIREEQGVIIDAEDNIIRHSLHDVRSAHFKQEEEDFTNLMVRAVNCHAEILQVLEGFLTIDFGNGERPSIRELNKVHDLINKAKGTNPKTV